MNLLCEFNGKNLRVFVNKDGETWSAVEDVCQILGLNNVKEALRSLDQDDKGYLAEYQICSNTNGLPVVNLSGLASLIFLSHKPKAKDFTQWVMKEVLPLTRRVSYAYLDSSERLRVDDFVKEAKEWVSSMKAEQNAGAMKQKSGSKGIISPQVNMWTLKNLFG